MATTPVSDALADRIMPREFSQGDDLSKFIKQCERYFLVRGIKEEKTKENIIFCLLDVDLHKEYEDTEGKATGFEARLRLAFEEPRDILKDLRELLNYRKGTEKAANFIKNVETLVKRVLSHELTEEKLTALCLVHASGSREIEGEVIMKKLEKVDDIKEVILLKEKISEKTEINAVRSYANVTNNSKPRQVNRAPGRSPNNGRQQCYNCNRMGHEAAECRNRKRFECWTCKKEGHISRNCPERKPPTCFACGKVGHIRRECTEVHCSRCQRNGHKASDCFSRLERKQQERYRESPREGRDNRYQHRRIAAIEEDDNYSIEGEMINNIEGDGVTNYPKARAPLVGEIVGAIN